MPSLWRNSINMNIQCCGRKFHTASSVAPVQLPSRMETHVWYILPDEVRSASLLNQYLLLLSPFEKEELSGMQGQLRKRALLARTLVRTTIAKYQIHPHVSARSLRFRKNIYGKPEVEWQHDNKWSPPPLCFNISHTSSLIACGLTVNALVGIDVEETQRRIKHGILSFARRYLSTHEVERLAIISDPEAQRREFIKLWTLKEAYVKAVGLGFSAAPFKTFTIRSKATTHVRDSNSEVTKIVVEPLDDVKTLTSNWEFSLLELAGSHYAAICRQAEDSLEGRRVTPMKITVWKTIPLLMDECVSGTDAVKVVT